MMLHDDPMKSRRVSAKCTASFAVAILVFCVIAVRAQDPRDLMPAASAAKAKELIAQTIEALGGQVYLNARDLDCKGRLRIV